MKNVYNLGARKRLYMTKIVDCETKHQHKQATLSAIFNYCRRTDRRWVGARSHLRTRVAGQTEQFHTVSKNTEQGQVRIFMKRMTRNPTMHVRIGLDVP